MIWLLTLISSSFPPSFDHDASVTLTLYYADNLFIPTG